MSVLVALTAQNTTAVTAIHELPPEFVVAQLDAVFSDIGVDAAKTGMLFSRALIETVAGYLAAHPVPLVVDPVMVASSGAKLLEDDAVEALVGAALPARDGRHAEPARGGRARRRSTARGRSWPSALHELGAPAVIVTGGHGDAAVDHLFDGARARRDPGRAARRRRDARRRVHALGDARGAARARAAARGRGARCGRARPSSRGPRTGSRELGAGDGPVDVLNLKGAA